jgi:hypothetical protein
MDRAVEINGGHGPPTGRGFAFAWFKTGNKNIGVYSLHVKSNLIMHCNEEVETAKNIRKREVAMANQCTPESGA